MLTATILNWYHFPDREKIFLSKNFTIVTFTQPRNSGLKFVNGSHTVIIVSDEGVEPTPELVLLLDDEMCDGSAATVGGFVPPQCDALVVKVDNPRLSGLTGRLCEKKNISF